VSQTEKLHGPDPRRRARDLINEAHQTCPYSKTVRGSIDLI
jgi:organic hydroperoxide reductase OsmC/OhrA